MAMDGINTIVIIAIGAFAIDRVVSAILFLLSFSGMWSRQFPDVEMMDGDPAARRREQKKQKLLYFTLGGVLALVGLGYYGSVRILHYMGFDTNSWLDLALTGLVLMGGSAPIADLLKGLGGEGAGAGKKGAEVSAPQPMEIRGVLTLEDARTGQTTPVVVSGNGSSLI